MSHDQANGSAFELAPEMSAFILKKHGRRVLNAVQAQVRDGEVTKDEDVLPAVERALTAEARSGLSSVGKGECAIDSRIPCEPPDTLPG